MNKKGSIDNIFVAIQVFGFAVFLLLIGAVWLFMSNNSQMQEDIWNKNTYTQKIYNNADRAYKNTDNIFLIVYFGLHLGVLVLGFFLRSHPIFLILTILVMVLIVLFSAPLSNVYQELILEPDLLESANLLPKTNYIMENLPKFEMFWTALTGIALIGFSRVE